MVTEKVDKKEKCRLEFWIKGFFSQIREILDGFWDRLGNEAKRKREMFPTFKMKKFQIWEFWDGSWVEYFLCFRFEKFHILGEDINMQIGVLRVSFLKWEKFWIWEVVSLVRLGEDVQKDERKCSQMRKMKKKIIWEIREK